MKRELPQVLSSHPPSNRGTEKVTAWKLEILDAQSPSPQTHKPLMEGWRRMLIAIYSLHS